MKNDLICPQWTAADQVNAALAIEPYSFSLAPAATSNTLP